MKKIFIFICIILSNMIIAQTTEDLDAKNGFRHFKFGSSSSQIKNIVKQENQYSKNPYVTVYDYVGTDIKTIFNVDVEDVTLTFFKDKLCSIQVFFGSLRLKKDFTLEEFKRVLVALENTYGEEWVNSLNQDGAIINSAIWNAKDIRLELCRLDFSKSKIDPVDYGFIAGYIHIMHKKLHNQIYTSEF
ncbi:hypothetical protein ACI76Q_09695 [Capnocytophaga canimorsus]|uniref:hypothetical protein n=1 Tax=Capnocytophaga canimorsus TaxID=28188 RepID=UPI00385C322C